ncbi:O-antigen ligase family protein [Cupriavidus plantarum]|uniref:O-antigen ligase family protein n=1 Tax=Cupriavidus plantarum TaxID=942865 RepID=UPI000E234356|nr:O-antigen ligase family protein [Cupriavidus plantarum]NYH98087.1 O-antigen ligase [Cupriavidus plantarum]REE91937.1 O-antigen ligase [Cupriavidus plantarum]CAG2127522.1 hypothetical protein LMG26296_00560 [Cupriavidus plantarum]SMR67299.1 O-antigen ligase [Cupriavidus plantarum]
MLRRPASTTFADALVFAFPILLLCVPRGAGVFMGCVGLLALLRYRGMGQTWRTYRDVLLPLSVAVFAFLLVYLASRIYFRTHWDVLDNPSRTLLAILTCWVFLHVQPSTRALWRGITIALAGALLIVCYQRIVQGNLRPSAWVQPIAFANMVAVFGLIGFVRAGAQRRTHGEAWGNILCAALIIAINGTRGAMLAMLITMLPMLLLRHRKLNVTAFVASAGAVVLIAIGSYFVPNSPVTGRVDQIVDDIHLYQQGKVDTSIGARLKMWELAADSIAAHPIMGVGVGQFARILHASTFCSREETLVCELEHAHNDLLEAASTTGIPGLIVVLGLFLVPGVLFWRRMRQSRRAGCEVGESIAGGGVCAIAAMLICGLTQVTMAHQANMVFYAGTVGLLLALAAAQASRRAAEI